MQQSSGILVLIPVLTAGAGRTAKPVDRYICLQERLRSDCYRIHHRDRHCGRVNTPAALGRRHTLKPMPATLGIHDFDART